MGGVHDPGWIAPGCSRSVPYCNLDLSLVYVFRWLPSRYVYVHATALPRYIFYILHSELYNIFSVRHSTGWFAETRPGAGILICNKEHLANLSSLSCVYYMRLPDLYGVVCRRLTDLTTARRRT